MQQSLIGIVFTTTLQEEEPFFPPLPSCSVSHPRFPRVALLSFDRSRLRLQNPAFFSPIVFFSDVQAM
jgi:hypothetical protein